MYSSRVGKVLMREIPNSQTRKEFHTVEPALARCTFNLQFLKIENPLKFFGELFR